MAYLYLKNMSRPPREFAPGSLYHTYNRGVRKLDLFRDDGHYERFTARLAAYAAEVGVAVLSYTLLPNHYHLLVQQRSDTPLSEFFRRLQTSTARYLQLKYKITGHVFEKRFQARHVATDAYLLHLTRYIHLNPAQHLRTAREALAVARAYPWSSCAAYLGERTDPLLNWEVIRQYVPRDVLAGYASFLLKGPWPPHDEEVR